MDIEQSLQQAIAHHQAGQIQDAERLYYDILQVAPKHPDANHNLGVLHKQSKQLKSALSLFRTALEVNPDQDQFWISCINVLIDLGQMDAALTVLKQGQMQGLQGDAIVQLENRLSSNLATRSESIENQSALTQAQIGAVISLHSSGQKQEAVDALNLLITQYPEEAMLYNMLGVCFADFNDLDNAVKSYQRALIIKPNYTEAHYHLGIALGDLNHLSDSVYSFEQAIAIQPDHAEAHNNLGVIFNKLGQFSNAIKSYKQAIQLKPDYFQAYYNLGNSFQDSNQLEAAIDCFERALNINSNFFDAWNNLGITFFSLGQIDEAIKSYQQALLIKPDFAKAHNNLGNALRDLGQLDTAVKCFKQALEIKPAYAEAHNNLGVTFKDIGQFNAAVIAYQQALIINPRYAEAHNNLGVILKDLEQLDASIKCFREALAINPDYAEAWANLFFPIKALGLSTSNVWLDSYKQDPDKTIFKNPYFAILAYNLNAFTPHSVDTYFDNAINALPLVTDEEIHNPSINYQKKEPSPIFNKMIALIHFGRSGTGLLHSLIDNHPEISTLPSVYFSEYYKENMWSKLIAQGWSKIPENFIKQFAVLFDARSSIPVPNIGESITNLGRKEGMANVGENSDEALMVDQDIFSSELQILMAERSKLNPQTFFSLVHIAYEKTLNNKFYKSTIFYHIHNPSPYAKLNFLRYNPEVKFLMMVREPIQSCESWIKKTITVSSEDTHIYIVTLLYDFDQIAFRKQESLGVRLEDLKLHPKATIKALCNWMGIKESSSLYEMTAQSKKWWGDPTSPDYSSKGMSPFDSSAITRKVGSIFSEQDQFILRTLFYPFSVRFGYVKKNIKGFREDLKTIYPLLDEPFGFQNKLAENLNQDLATITNSCSALYLRAALHERWKVLNEFNDYPHMLKPLIIKES